MDKSHLARGLKFIEIGTDTVLFIAVKCYRNVLSSSNCKGNCRIARACLKRMHSWLELPKHVSQSIGSYGKGCWPGSGQRMKMRPLGDQLLNQLFHESTRTFITQGRKAGRTPPWTRQTLVSLIEVSFSQHCPVYILPGIPQMPPELARMIGV